MKALVYDIEIVKAIPEHDGNNELGIDYCAGWRDHGNMGISVIGAYDYETDRYRVFCKDNFGLFLDATTGKLLVGFNSIAFDNAVINATLGVTIPEDHCYDLLRETWAAFGLGQVFNYKTHGGFSLDAICKRNFGIKKTGNGALAPKLWQRGEIGAVIDYCLNDVAMTKTFFDHVISGKVIKKDGLSSFLRVPECGEM